MELKAFRGYNSSNRVSLFLSINGLEDSQGKCTFDEVPLHSLAGDGGCADGTVMGTSQHATLLSPAL
jgi:hypothetical protein